MLCSEAIAVNRNSRGGQAAILTCKRWSCEICHPVNRNRVIGAAKRGHPDSFLTLTCRPMHHDTPDDAARAMVSAFAKLIRMARKRWPTRRIEYLRVFEAHKSGWPHLHILMRAPFIPQSWLSEQWLALTGAFMVDIRKVKDEKLAAYYIAKYIGKALHKFAGVTRWFRSKQYNSKEEDQAIRHTFGREWYKKEGNAWWELLKLMETIKIEGSFIEERRHGYFRWAAKIEER